MRILFITPLYLPHMGGLEVLASELLSGLRARGHEVSLLTAHLEESQAGFEVANLSNKSPAALPKTTPGALSEPQHNGKLQGMAT